MAVSCIPLLDGASAAAMQRGLTACPYLNDLTAGSTASTPPCPDGLGTYANIEIMRQSELLIKDLGTRFVVATAAVAFLILMVWTNWNGAVGHVSVSIVHWRIFSVAIIGFASIHFFIWSLAPRWRTMGKWPVWTMVISLAVIVGLAIGTTDWEGWTMSRWWQFWWTVAMSMGAFGQISRILKSQSSSAEPPPVSPDFSVRPTST